MQRQRFNFCLSMLYDASQSSVHLDTESPAASCKSQLQACGSAKMDRTSLTARLGRSSTPLEPAALMWPCMHCEENSTLQEMQRYCKYADSIKHSCAAGWCIVDVLQRKQVPSMPWLTKNATVLC